MRTWDFAQVGSVADADGVSMNLRNSVSFYANFSVLVLFRLCLASRFQGDCPRLFPSFRATVVVVKLCSRVVAASGNLTTSLSIDGSCCRIGRLHSITRYNYTLLSYVVQDLDCISYWDSIVILLEFQLWAYFFVCISVDAYFNIGVIVFFDKIRLSVYTL